MEIEQENEQLADENLRLRQQLAQKELNIQEAGSLAEAAMRLADVFNAAQEAADIYLLNVRRMAGVSSDVGRSAEESTQVIERPTKATDTSTQGDERA